MAQSKSLHETLVEHTEDAYRHEVIRVARHLRSLADEIQRDGLRVQPRVTSSYDALPSYGDAAHRIIHNLHWGIANANLDGLIRAAADADYALRAQIEED